jgi:hypothetical protein
MVALVLVLAIILACMYLFDYSVDVFLYLFYSPVSWVESCVVSVDVNNVNNVYLWDCSTATVFISTENIRHLRSMRSVITQ